MPFIEARGIAKSFATSRGLKAVLRDCSLAAERGEFVAVLGAMGSGKSTLLSILAGLLRPDQGTVTVDGAPVRDIRPDTGVVFQSYSLLPWCSAIENVRLAVDASDPDASPGERRARAAEALTRVGLGSALTRRPAQLSGGMRQRVAIARALATGPAILLLDEPFGALDALTRATLQQDVMRLCASKQGVTVVMITNNIDEAILMSDRIVPMTPGRPASLGTPIPIDLPRPRSEAMIADDERAWAVRAEVMNGLTRQAGDS
jgi:nitrate/nitrite transport system ATP-binding protein